MPIAPKSRSTDDGRTRTDARAHGFPPRLREMNGLYPQTTKSTSIDGSSDALELYE